MSGVEIAGAVAVASLATSGVSFISQMDIENEAEDLRIRENREQSVALRLQQNEASIQRQKQLERLLATEEVGLAVRNISPSSGSVRATSIRNLHEFYEDENASELNHAAKQLALIRQSQFCERRN